MPPPCPPWSDEKLPASRLPSSSYSVQHVRSWVLPAAESVLPYKQCVTPTRRADAEPLSSKASTSKGATDRRFERMRMWARDVYLAIGSEWLISASSSVNRVR